MLKNLSNKIMNKFKSGEADNLRPSQATLSASSGKDLKRIMPNKCDCCDIGIGTSMLKEGKTWIQHQHIFDQFHTFRTPRKKYKVCKWCFEDLQKHKRPLAYMRR
jgi:hypothetical protein